MKVLKLLALAMLVAATSASAAGPRFELILGIFDGAQGHSTELRSYRDVIRIRSFPDEESCLDAGEFAQEDFSAQRNKGTLSQDLLDFTCSSVHP